VREWKKKICMVGQFGVGKTSLVRRFVDSIFDERYLTTIGVKVSHLRGASGYILVADGCRAASLAKAVELQKRVADQLGPLPFVLVLNKADLRDRWEVQPASVSVDSWPTFETSAKTGAGVEEMFLALARKLLE
jgi:GTPase SAR1 family protein